MNKPKVLFNYIGHLPECPTWDATTHSLLWTDIIEQQVHRFFPESEKHTVISFNEEVGCFALREKGGFILAMRTGIFLTNEQGEVESRVCENPNNPLLARFNDGGVDQDGRFYAGTYWEPKTFNGALLLRIDSDLRPKVIQNDILCANGLAFSPDKQWMYTSDTPNHVIYRTPMTENGELGLREIFKTFPIGKGCPDGAAVDVEGCYWTAMFDGHRIARISPTGEVLEEHELPVRCPTMVCFGSDDMKTLYITTTRENMEEIELAERPLSGALFSIRTAVAGMIKPNFKEEK
ncbi:gluconolactonase [Psychromonas ingrahamii 37]|uniref:Gluconolactonase n=1 Tax=Psychromonas ingrahamii (strain DSM 17664 / CCUG 51855 / 37) TaxID=357804 RepID=A1SWI2_PSYIN|nr:SMP-30/gluconolactonase/LRE family protein [Psychromonas ingrahamii]ABM03847.1 gluconolactonase [Psychromonas ingrahamii 37]